MRGLVGGLVGGHVGAVVGHVGRLYGQARRAVADSPRTDYYLSIQYIVLTLAPISDLASMINIDFIIIKV